MKRSKIMKLANIISLRVFINPEENREKIREAFLNLLGWTEQELLDEKIFFKETKAKGFSEKIIIIIEASLEKDRHCNEFLKKLSQNLSKEDKQLLIEQTNRLDQELNFFLRLDKNSLLENKYVLTDSGECFHIKISVAAFPKRPDAAHKVVKMIFS